REREIEALIAVRAVEHAVPDADGIDLGVVGRAHPLRECGRRRVRVDDREREREREPAEPARTPRGNGAHGYGRSSIVTCGSRRRSLISARISATCRAVGAIPAAKST